MAKSYTPRMRHRHDGWTPARQMAFLRALSDTGCVRDACARVRLSNTSAYRLRAKFPEFGKAWDRALARSAVTIEQAAFERAVEGWEEPIVHQGKVVAQRRRYSDSLLRLLLTRGQLGGSGARPDAGAGPAEVAAPGSDLVMRAHQAAKAAGGIFTNRATEAQTDAAIRKQLDGLAERLRRKAAQAGQDGGALNGDDGPAMAVVGIEPVVGARRLR